MIDVLDPWEEREDRYCGELLGTECRTGRAIYYVPEREPMHIRFTMRPESPGIIITPSQDEIDGGPYWYWQAEGGRDDEGYHRGELIDPQFCPDCGARLGLDDDGLPTATRHPEAANTDGTQPPA